MFFLHIVSFADKLIFSEKFKSVPNASPSTHKARNDLRAAMKKWWPRLLGQGEDRPFTAWSFNASSRSCASNGNLGFAHRSRIRSHDVTLARPRGRGAPGRRMIGSSSTGRTRALHKQVSRFSAVCTAQSLCVAAKRLPLLLPCARLHADWLSRVSCFRRFTSFKMRAGLTL